MNKDDIIEDQTIKLILGRIIMNSKFRQKYKVDRSAVQEAFENQMCLKRNE